MSLYALLCSPQHILIVPREGFSVMLTPLRLAGWPP